MNTKHSKSLDNDHTPLSRTLTEKDYAPNWGTNGLNKNWKALSPDEIKLMREGTKPSDK